MRAVIRRCLTWIGGLAVLYLIVAGVIFLSMTRKKDVPNKTILELHLEREVVEYTPDDPIGQGHRSGSSDPP
jgi:hypothetical protein